MSVLRSIAGGLRSLFRKERVGRELDEELNGFLEMAAEEKIKQGMSRKDALRAVRLDGGTLEVSKEIVRSAGWESFIETLWQDLRFATRTLRKVPGFTVVAVLTLALGIGANTAIFSVIEAVLLRPLPYKDPSRVVLLPDPQDPNGEGISYRDFESWKSQSRSFEDMAVYYRNSGWSRVTLTGAGEPDSVQGAFVSANFFPLMGISPVLGRAFTREEEARQQRVVVLSYGQWVRRFGASRDVVGKMLPIDGSNSQVIGVMPANFQLPARDSQFWAPITTNRYWGDPQLARVDSTHTRHFYKRWNVVGRLKPGITYREAQAEMDTIIGRLQQLDPTNRERSVNVVPLRVNLRGNTRLAFSILFAAVFFVLLIACSNVGNLILARGAARDREMAVRTALGAGRVRLTRQLFTESVLLALLSGCLGLVFASLGVHALIAFGPPDIPRLDEASVDDGVLAFTLALSLLAAVIFGMIPAWKISQSNPNESLKSGARSASGSMILRGTRNLLVVMEFALAMVLLTGAGLLVRSFLAVQGVDPGFRSERVLTMRIMLPAGTPESRRTAVYDEVIERVRTMHGVQAAGAIDGLFELGETMNLGLRTIEGRAPEPPEQWTALTWKTIRGDYFQAMGVPLLRGRYFSEQDVSGSPLAAIADESMARRYWPGEDAIGKRFKGQDPRGRNDDWLTVIGVVHDMRRHGLERSPTPHIFEWYKQATLGDTTPDLVVRTQGEPLAFAATLRSTVRGLDQTAILSPVTTMEAQLSGQLSPRRFQTTLLSLFSLLALILASVGMFALMHYSVSQRTHEIGVRIALGAQRGDVMRLVIWKGGQLALTGVGIGILAALALTRLMSSLLFGVSVTDPATIGGVAMLLTLVALIGCYIPMRRAMRVDPIVALRYE
ncbi:MAG: hypothetical protein DMG38_27030 [Acidobacteria bacterium]|nr:MAG: hypothetical protein DMG38_27030 [Acidobacteriota bacterium]